MRKLLILLILLAPMGKASIVLCEGDSRLTDAVKAHPTWQGPGPVGTEFEDCWARQGPFDGPPPWVNIEREVMPEPEPAPDAFIALFGLRPTVPPGANPVRFQPDQGQWDNYLMAWQGTDGSDQFIALIEDAQQVYSFFGAPEAVAFKQRYFGSDGQWFCAFDGQRATFFRAPIFECLGYPDRVVTAYQGTLMDRYGFIPSVIHPSHSPIFLARMVEKFKDDPVASVLLQAALNQQRKLLERFGFE